VLLAGHNDDKPSEVVVVNDNNEDVDAATLFGYDVTEVPAETFTFGATDYDGEEEEEVEKPPFHGLEKYVSREQLDMWMNEYRQMLLRGEPKSVIKVWVRGLFRRHGRSVIGTEPCTRRHGLYRADVRATPYVGVTSSCHVCSK